MTHRLLVDPWKTTRLADFFHTGPDWEICLKSIWEEVTVFVGIFQILVQSSILLVSITKSSIALSFLLVTAKVEQHAILSKGCAMPQVL